MIKNSLKKTLSFFSVSAVLLVLFAFVGFDSFAADGVVMRLEKLKEDYPSGAYYNHKVSSDDDTVKNLLESRDEKFASVITNHPCTAHGTQAVKGDYDCNYFDNGYQCHGFASILFYEIFAQRQSDLEKRENPPFDIKPGDLVRVHGDTHSVIVVSVEGDSFTVAESNVGLNGEAPACAIVWGSRYNISDIDYYVRASNYRSIYNDTNWKNIDEKENLGNSFFAAICSISPDHALTDDGMNGVTIRKYTGDASQVWKFTRIKNGSYRIENCKTGKALEVEGAVKNGRAAVVVSKYASKTSQRWAFYSKDGEFLISADCGTSLLTAEVTSEVSVDTTGTGGYKLFTVEKKKPPVASVIKAKASESKVTLSWTKGKYTKSFDLEIFDSSSESYKKYKGLTGTSLSLSLPAGNYSAVITSKNNYTETEGNRVYFTVSKKGVLGTPAKVSGSATTTTVSLSWTAVPDADGYGLFQKKNGEWVSIGATEKRSFTVKKLSKGKKYTFAVRAFKKSNGKIVLAPKYKTFTAATKPGAPSKRTASQTTTSVTLSWSKLSGATSYRIYRKTSSGWELCTSTEKTKYTVKNLTPGKSYTYGIRAGIKSTLLTIPPKSYSATART